MARPKVSLVDKVRKEFPEFATEIDSLSQEQMDARIAQLAKDAEDVQDAKDADEALEDAQANAALLNAPYREAKKAIRLKSRYIMAMLKGGI